MDVVTRGAVTPRPPWSIEDSDETYAVRSWGSGYFGINGAGHVVCRPDRNDQREIDLYEVVQQLSARDLTAPVVLRFSDLLRDRLRSVHDAFAAAITENDYKKTLKTTTGTATRPYFRSRSTSSAWWSRRSIAAAPTSASASSAAPSRNCSPSWR